MRVADYASWNQAVVDVVFTEDQAGRPVYLDVESDVLREIAKRAGGDLEDPVSDLAAAVASTLSLRPWDTNVLHMQVKWSRNWRLRLRRRHPGEALSAPLSLGLLTLLTIAAEQMGEDTNYAPNAYYPRLFGLLGISDEHTKQHFKNSFYAHAEELWSVLNEWLGALDGMLGTPTAYALSFRYVGLAFSQALVRGTDRARFPSLFRQFGLAPGTQMSPSDMIFLLDSWIGQEPCPISGSLRKLWDGGAARERIAIVAALELEAWDGTTGESVQTGETSHDVRLLASLRTFPVSSLDLSLSASIPGSSSHLTVSVDSAGGARPTLDLERGPDGWLRARALSGVDPGSLLSGLLTLREPDSGAVVTRRPRPLVPLRKDELQGMFVEMERVQLGEDCILLVFDENGLADKVATALATLARPGFRRVGTLAGLPVSWVLFRDVQVMAVAGADLPTTLNPLVPIVTSQLALAGGLKLPGRIRKFSSLDPPEIRAVTQNADSVSVTLTSVDPDAGHEEQRWESMTSAVVVPLAGLHIPDGDYTIQLYEGGSKNPRQQSTLRLRSGDFVDPFMWERATRLIYDVELRPGISMLSAAPFREGCGTYVEGPSASGTGCIGHVDPASAAWWIGERPKPRIGIAADAVVARPDPSSCVVTGAHYILLPPFYGAPYKLPKGEIEGVCKWCGLVKRYPKHAPSKKAALTAQPLKAIDVGLLPAVHVHGNGWDVAVDGLMHSGGGLVSSLARLAMQVEESGLFLDTFVRGLVVLGHIQIERGTDLRAAQWEVTPTYLAQVSNGSFVLVGYWPASLRDAIGKAVLERGGELTSEGQRVPGPLVRRILHVSADDMADIVSTTYDQVGATEVRDAARAMLAALTPLSEIRSELSLIPLPSARTVQRFDLPSSSWVDVTNISGSGAYRLVASFNTRYVHVSDEEYSVGSGRIGTAQLVKHLAAFEAGTPLLAYDQASRLLSVPLGADLPDLYGRAASLCSGVLPFPVLERRSLVYPDVPADVASAINGLLTT